MHFSEIMRIFRTAKCSLIGVSYERKPLIKRCKELIDTRFIATMGILCAHTCVWDISHVARWNTLYELILDKIIEITTTKNYKF